jgi:hypothetical protein
MHWFSLQLFSNNIAKALCWTLIHSLWQGLLLAFVTGAIVVLKKIGCCIAV